MMAVSAWIITFLHATLLPFVISTDTLECIEICKNVLSAPYLINRDKCNCTEDNYILTNERDEQELETKFISYWTDTSTISQPDSSGIYYEPAETYIPIYQHYTKQPFFITDPLTKIYDSKTFDDDMKYSETNKIIQKRRNINHNKFKRNNITQNKNEDNPVFQGQSLYMDIGVDDLSFREVNKDNLFDTAQLTEDNLTNCIELHISLYLRKNNKNKLRIFWNKKQLEKYETLPDMELLNEIQNKCNKIEDIIKKCLDEVLETIPKVEKSRSSLYTDENAEHNNDMNGIFNTATYSTNTVVDENDTFDETALLNTINVDEGSLRDTTNLNENDPIINKIVSTRSTPALPINSILSRNNKENISFYQTTPFESDHGYDVMNNIVANNISKFHNLTNQSNNQGIGTFLNNNNNIEVFTESAKNTFTEVSSQYDDDIKKIEINNDLINFTTSIPNKFITAAYDENDKDNTVIITKNVHLSSETLPTNDFLNESTNEIFNNVNKTVIVFSAEDKIDLTEKPLSTTDSTTFEQRPLNNNLEEVTDATISLDDFANDFENNTISTTILPFHEKTTEFIRKIDFLQEHPSMTSENTEITGKLYFLYNKSYLPARFIQNNDGKIHIGIDGIFLCNKLLNNSNNSVLLKKICGYNTN